MVRAKCLTRSEKMLKGNTSTLPKTSITAKNLPLSQIHDHFISYMKKLLIDQSYCICGKMNHEFSIPNKVLHGFFRSLFAFA